MPFHEILFILIKLFSHSKVASKDTSAMFPLPLGVLEVIIWGRSVTATGICNFKTSTCNAICHDIIVQA